MSRYLLPALVSAVVLLVVLAVMWRRAERDAVTEARRADAAETKVRHLSERNAELRVELDGVDDRYWPMRWSDRTLHGIHNLPTTPEREYPR